LREWKAGTSNFRDINGKLDALLMFNDVTNDYTAEDYRMPIFTYGGDHSIVPIEETRWLTVSKGNRAGDFHLWFYGEIGNHVPFLNPPPSVDWFFGNLTTWMRALTVSAE
jgi:hypothetical protein